MIDINQFKRNVNSLMMENQFLETNKDAANEIQKADTTRS
jgi:hypothetical protein